MGVKTSRYCKPDRTLLREALIQKAMHEKSVATTDNFLICILQLIDIIATV